MNRIRPAAAIALAAVLFACATPSVHGQSTNSGNIRGTVTDTTGADIPGATVTVTDVDKDVTKTFTTDAAGVYDTGPIVADHYKITFSKSGFQTLIRGPITLDVGVQGIDAKLQVGSESVEVTVTADVPLLETESGAQERTLTSQTMAQLPQVGADWENFIWLQPGAAGTPQNSGSAVQPNAGQTAINGNLPFESVLADGATTTLPMSQNADVTIFEATGEVKISSSGFGAQYGIGNVIYNQISKGGTDRFHGSAYEYFQNDALNALPYAFGTHPKKGPLRYNNFGFNVGGFVIPHRMFFFFDYDRTINNGGSNIGFQTVPTTAFQNGTFNAGIPDLYDPTTQTIQQSGSHTYVIPGGSFTQTCPCVIRKTFASEYGSNAIPAAMIDKVSAAVQKYFPAPNVSNPNISSNGIAQNNYTFNTPNQNPFKKYFGRLDWDITHGNRLTVSETSSDNPATFLNEQICPLNCQHGDVSRDNAQVSDVWLINSNLTNEARMGFTDQMNYFTPFSIGQGYPSKLGWQFGQTDEFPNVSLNGFYGLGNSTNAVYKEMVFDPSDVVSMVRGRHILHFGGEFLIMRADSTAWGNLNPGNVTYNGSFTSINGQIAVTPCTGCAAYASGLSYADFLMGQTSGWNARVTPEFGARQKGPQIFVQDDIKLTPHLTINAGLRWEANTGWSEVKGNETVWDPTVINPANNTPGAMWYGTSKANGRTQLIAPQWNIWLPRVGFAWQPMPNTVLRGAFGMYASMLSEDTYGAGMGSQAGQFGTYNDSTSGICPVVQFSGTGTTPDTTDPGCGTGQFNGNSILSNYLNAPTTPDAQNNPGGSVSFNQYHTPVPTNYQWTLSFERQLGANYAFYLAYVGNHGTNLNFPVDINQVPQSKLGPNDLASKPNPLFGSINGSTNNAISNFHALEADIRKRLSYNLEFDVNYTWSHFLDDLDSSGWGARGGFQNYQNAFVPGDNYSNANFDVRNAFKGQAIYTLPFGRRQKFMNSNWALDLLAGGWRVSSTWVVQSGSPFGITTGNNNNSGNQSGGYTQFANLVGNPYISGSVKSRLNEYYNLAAFQVPTQYTYGNFRRNIITGPGIGVMNASLGKTFDLWPDRGVKFEIRADSFNVLNHASFGNPGNNAIGPGQSAQITGVTVGGRSVQLYGKISF